MKNLPLALLTAALLWPVPGTGVDHVQDADNQPHRLSNRPSPQKTFIFRRAKGSTEQSLEVRYEGARAIRFRLDQSEPCQRHEQGVATVKPGRGLGVETDENEAGDSIAVQEYIYKKSSQCTMYIRIDEGGWTQATVNESPECSRSCSASKEAMRLEK